MSDAQDAIRKWVTGQFPSSSPATIIWPTSNGIAVKRPGADWEWFGADTAAEPTKRSETDEQRASGTRTRPNIPGATEGDE